MNFFFLAVCPDREVWSACGAGCQMTCEGRPDCDDQCVPGCICSEDFPYRHEGNCVNLDTCQAGNVNIFTACPHAYQMVSVTECDNNCVLSSYLNVM